MAAASQWLSNDDGPLQLCTLLSSAPGNMYLCLPLHVDRAGAVAQALRAEGVPVNAIAVNQVTPCAVAVAVDCRHRQVALLKSHAPACQLQVLEASASQQFLASKRADQQRALAKLREDPALRCCLCCLLCRRCLCFQAVAGFPTCSLW